MKIYLGSDHAGFELKEKIKSFLLEKSFEVNDCGTYKFNKDDDYPEIIVKTAMSVSENPESKGIVFGKSGAGECIVANKIKGIRAVLGFSTKNVELSRLDNNTNILSLGSMFTNENLAKELVNAFLETEFSNEERHIRRIRKITDIENNIIQKSYGK
jgi:ribose 5-phosphate isomerase B